MYDIVPDLLKAYYISLCAAFVLGTFLGFGLCYLWLAREKPLVEPETEPMIRALREAEEIILERL